EGVVVVAGTDQVLAVDRAAEPFEAVVGAVVYLHVLDRGARTQAGQGDAVELDVREDLEAGVHHAHVLEHAAVVGVVVAAVEAVGTFNLRFAGRAARLRGARAGADRGAAEQHEAAPLADRVDVGGAFHALAAGEHD